MASRYRNMDAPYSPSTSTPFHALRHPFRILKKKASARSTTPHADGTELHSQSSPPHHRRPRQLGCRKQCCDAFCLRVGSESCCAHAQQGETDDDDEGRYCSYCYDRRREERRTLRQLEHRRLRLQLIDPDNASIDSNSSIPEVTPPRTAIPKACCGNACAGLSYTHCCEHAGISTAITSLHDLISNYDSYCQLCRHRCRQRNALGAEQGDCDSSVGAVRLQPRRIMDRTKPNPNMAERLEKLQDAELHECVTRCLASMECPVCLEGFGTHDPCTLPCGHSVCQTHVFHLNKCPICRWELVPEWKTYAQPSIALRESAKAVQETVSRLLEIMEQQQQQQQQQRCRPVQALPVEKPCAVKDVITTLKCVEGGPSKHGTTNRSTSSVSTTDESESSEGDDKTPVPSSPTQTRVPSQGLSVDC